MKNRIFKGAVSAILTLVMIMSASVVAIVPANAAAQDTYTVNCLTQASTSTSDVYIRVYGTEGTTGWHNLGEIGDDENTSAQFTDRNVGEITKIEIEHIIDWFQDLWNPSVITVKNSTDETTFYNSNPLPTKGVVTLSNTDIAYSLNIKTSKDKNSGTDADVLVKLTDTAGSSFTTELSALHPKANAFEAEDDTTIYITAPTTMEKIKSIELSIDTGTWYKLGADWRVLEFTLTQLTGENAGDTFTKTVNQWITEDEPFTATF